MSTAWDPAGHVDTSLDAVDPERVGEVTGKNDVNRMPPVTRQLGRYATGVRNGWRAW
jgi:hypothetical protein